MTLVCSNTFLSIFWRRDTIAFWKMSLLHWFTKLTHQTLFREKATGEVLWMQWRHEDWTLKTVSEIVFCFIFATGFKRVVISTRFTETIFWYQWLLFLLSSLSLLLRFSLPFCSYCCYLCNCGGVLLVIIGVCVIVAAIVVIFVVLLLLLHYCFVLFNIY